MSVLERWQDEVLAIFRIVIGFLFATHGLSSLFGVLGAEGRQVEAFAWPGWWAAVIQLVGGFAVMIGLGTRVAALLCSGSMAYAYFIVHQPDGLFPIENGGEKAALFAFAFLLIAFLGAGTWAIEDGLKRTERERQRATA
ncbi:DoxX family protein [Kribbella deserti]|uniref:DoxX family protein n=1 Tax=Kribbella deserti TaxID=1926257 RepID=A0ABV6QIU6_9ACTN